MIFELAQDFHDAVAAIPRGHPKRRILELLEEAIRRDVHFVDRHPTTLFQCLWNTCWWFDCPDRSRFFDTEKSSSPNIQNVEENAELYAFMETWQGDPRRLRRPWARALRPPFLALDSPLKTVFCAHSSNVTALAFLRDPVAVVTGSADCTVRVWDMLTGIEIHCLRGHSGAVLDIAVNANSTLIASSASDGTVRVWRISDGTLLSTLSGHSGRVQCVDFSPDCVHLASGGNDGTVRVWNCATSEQTLVIQPDEEVCSVAYLPSGKRLLSGGLSGKVRCIDGLNGAVLQTLLEGGPPVESICVDPVQKMAAIGIGDRIVLWAFEATSSRKVVVLHLQNDTLLALAWSPDGARLAAATRRWDDSGAAYVLDIATCDGLNETPVSRTHRINIVGHPVADVGFSHRGSVILLASGKSCYSWNATGSESTEAPFDHTYAVETVDLSPSGDLMATGAHNGDVGLWNVETPTKPAIVFQNAGNQVHDVRFSPSGSCIALACSGGVGATVLLDHCGRKIIATLKQGRFLTWNRVTSVRFSKDGKACVAGASDGTVALWNLETNTRTAEYGPLETATLAVAMSADGQLIAAAERGNSPAIHVWDTTTGRELHTLRGHLYSVSALAFHENGFFLFSQSLADGREAPAQVRKWDLRTDACVWQHSGNTDIRALASGSLTQCCLAFSNDKETVFVDPAACFLIVPYQERLSHLTTRDDSRFWVGASGNHMFCLRLEDVVDSQLL